MNKPGWLWLVFVCLCGGPAFAGITNTKHNLSATSGNTVRATSESQICIFCHTPHNASPQAPLWNRQSPGSGYMPYNSTTVKAKPGQPTGASLLCLSCHDGTIALGKVLSRSSNIAMRGGVTTMPSGSTNLGKDLRNDHPISFSYQTSYNANTTEFARPDTLTGAVKLDGNGQLQCTSCHEPHDNPFGKFLVMNPIRGALCTTCHKKSGWGGSAHESSSKTAPNGQSVRDNACQNCHTPHNATTLQRLLTGNGEETLCFTCHDGSPAKNIQSEFNKVYRHPVTLTTGVHDPTESDPVNSKHVECMDCHNPHAAKPIGSGMGPLTGVRGISSNGGNVNPVSREYEVCFRCHGDTANRNSPPAPTTRQNTTVTNTRQEFNNHQSYHPVIRQTGNSVPSFNRSVSIPIKCSDCHNNNDSNGPRGPHGSNNNHLLKLRNDTGSGLAYSATRYALCYSCHNESSIVGNVSFTRHSFHIGAGGGMGGGMTGGGGMGSPGASCNTCHDPHGSPPSPNGQNMLINFDRSIVDGVNGGEPRFVGGNGSGSCYLTCHGRVHNPCSYPGGMMCGGGMGGGMR